jgi:hypothetical protein
MMHHYTRIAVVCPYCGKPASLVVGRVIYPHRSDLADKPVWACLPCGAWVGCHPGTKRPLGRLADADLRKAKMAAHAAFDPLWRSGEMRRKAAYAWLAKQLGITGKEAHIGMFDLATCRRVVETCEARIRQTREEGEIEHG